MPNAKEPLEGEVIQRGRPSIYDPSMCEKIIDVAAHGGHVSEMCLSIGVRSRDTWYRWKEEHPEFKEAVEYAELVSQAYYERLLNNAAHGLVAKTFNFNSLAMIMNNKFPTEYKRSPNGNSGTEINIGSINSIERLDESMLDKKIAAITQKLEGVKTSKEDNINDSLRDNGE